jgi:hypothetical protein
MAPTITLSKDFNIDDVTFSDVKMLDNGGKIVYMSYAKAPLLLQTPVMKAPFGLSKWDNDGKNVAKYNIDLSFGGKDTSPQISAFYDVLDSMDKRLVDVGFASQSTWFKGKKYTSREIVEALYTPMIKLAKDKQTGEVTDRFPPTVKLTIPFKDNAFKCDVYDDKKNIVDLNNIDTKGSKITAIIQCSGLWFAGGKYGTSWRVVQMRVVPSMSVLSSYAFRDDDDEQDD